MSEGCQAALAVWQLLLLFQSWSWCLRAIRQLLQFVVLAVVSGVILVSEGYHAALAVC